MSDDWRLRVQLEAESRAHELMARLAARDLKHDLAESFHDRVVVSRDGSTVFCYADSRDQAEAAARSIDSLKDEHDWQLTSHLERWHPTAERWEPPEEGLPTTASEQSLEHDELIEAEREESRHQGFPMFEVRLKCDSRQDAEDLARRLEAEGIPTVHRWQFIVVGAADEDSANALAARIRSKAPPGTEVMAEASLQEVAQNAPYATPFGPFSVFGGLAG
ncbi:MAG: hypothetical protein JOZ73_08845 [Solirubrobacterales bacterium]|nr:hypothetical protein [Solirubrobacterales bacterium]